jgi:hypothetical protein
VIQLANEARSKSQAVREAQLRAIGNEINKVIQRAIDKGEYESYIIFPLSIKEECLDMLKNAGYSTVSSGNVNHQGKYQIKISWK